MNAKEDCNNFDSFEIVKRESLGHREEITVTFYTGKENCLRFSKAALMVMGNPTYAQVLINPKTHQMLLMGTNEKRPNCILLYHY